MNIVDIIQILVNILFSIMKNEIYILGKVLSVYIKNFYPQLHFEFEQLLDASYNVWHRLNDEEKISLATFLEEIIQENNHVRFY
jgi:hypothetical protein